MSSTWRALTARLLTPSAKTTSLEVRGFHEKDAAAKKRLETIGARFLGGFRIALESPDVATAGARLDTVDRPYRGFAYEGAAMALAVLDGLVPWGRGRVERFIAGPAARHVYMAHIGIGWAYGRLPRSRWRFITPTDPVLRWLALDGYGFYRAFFQTKRWVGEQHVERDFPWPPEGPADYANRVIDQGIGRAMWFIGGTAVDRVTALISAFPEPRHNDLWSGAGLAATYACGVTEAELRAFWANAGPHQPAVAQAAAFAAKTRVLAGLATEETRMATAVFCGATPEEAAAVTDETLVDLPPDGVVPAFEVWRQRIQKHFV